MELDIVGRAFEEKSDLEYSSRLSQFLSVWAKMCKLEKMSDFKARLKALEDAMSASLDFLIEY